MKARHRRGVRSKRVQQCESSSSTSDGVVAIPPPPPFDPVDVSVENFIKSFVASPTTQDTQDATTCYFVALALCAHNPRYAADLRMAMLDAMWMGAVMWNTERHDRPLRAAIDTIVTATVERVRRERDSVSHHTIQLDLADALSTVPFAVGIGDDALTVEAFVRESHFLSDGQLRRQLAIVHRDDAQLRSVRWHLDAMAIVETHGRPVALVAPTKCPGTFTVFTHTAFMQCTDLDIMCDAVASVAPAPTRIVELCRTSDCAESMRAVCMEHAVRALPHMKTSERRRVAAGAAVQK